MTGSVGMKIIFLTKAEFLIKGRASSADKPFLLYLLESFLALRFSCRFNI